MSRIGAVGMLRKRIRTLNSVVSPKVSAETDRRSQGPAQVPPAVTGMGPRTRLFTHLLNFFTYQFVAVILQ